MNKLEAVTYVVKNAKCRHEGDADNIYALICDIINSDKETFKKDWVEKRIENAIPFSTN
jgi:hypothetical protein